MAEDYDYAAGLAGTDPDLAPVDSAGDVVAEEAQARSDDAYAGNPPNDPAPEPLDVEGRITAEDVEVGTNDPIRTLNDTQATPPSDPNARGNFFPGRATTQGGVGAPGDDSGAVTKNSTRTAIDGVFNTGKIIPQANILDQYGSYTYAASLYLMKPEAYTQLMKSSKKTIAGSQLLIQSGGAPVGGRNPYFSNDYYIDKIVLKSVITGKGTNAAHNVNDVKFTITEPNGISLIPNLDKAVQSYLGSAGEKKKNYASAVYLLVIRFYGYDDIGKLVQGGVPGVFNGTGAGSAFVEKFYPITISDIKFKIANKVVEYEVTGTAVSTQIAAGAIRGSIPYNVELGGMTVKEALNGPAQIIDGKTGKPVNDANAAEQVTGSRTVAGATAVPTSTERESTTTSEAPGAEGGADANAPAAPPKASSAPTPKPTVRQGLFSALNQFQQELVKKGIYTYPDTYSVEFAHPSLEQATIQVKNPEKNQTGSSKPATAADAKDPSKNRVDNKTRNLSVVAGTQIVQFITKILQNSSYVTDQAIVKASEQPGGKLESNGKPGNNVASFKINMVATPKKYDPKRNDYAYDIKYVVGPYKLSNLISNYYQIPKFNGVHKEYNYWFTGENTQVLSYEQSYNALYHAVMSGNPGQLGGTIIQDAIKTNFQPNSNESNQGAKNNVNEIGANFTDALFNPGDLASATLQIIGDPAWLQQGDVNPVFAKTFNPNPFMADGTINFDSQQILFEILINTPSDYNLATGVIDPNVRNTVFQSNNRPGATRQSYVYQATECLSEFARGKFTQTLKGVLLTYLPDQTFKDRQASGRPAAGAGKNAALGSRPTATGGLNNAAGRIGNGTLPGTNSTGSNAGTRDTTNPAAAENTDGEWTEVDGVMVSTEDQWVDNGDGTFTLAEDANNELDIPEVDPGPEDPTSDGDIEPVGNFGGDAEEAGVNDDGQIMAREA
jgi:hypothetical protein